MKKRDIRFASIPSTEEVAAERERLFFEIPLPFST